MVRPDDSCTGIAGGRVEAPSCLSPIPCFRCFDKLISSGEGRYRATSLLPPTHIAVVVTDQIVPDLESWWATQKKAGLEQIRRYSNLVVITGPSRTADIAMQLVMGMHGSRELHLVLVN